jgi:plastocyanin
MTRRLVLALVGVLLVLLPAPAIKAAPASPSAGTRGVELPETGALFGAFVKIDDHNGDTRREALTNFEALVGRKMAIERVYDNWEEAWPTDDDLWSRDAGRILFYSWNASFGDGSGCAHWADIAAGLYDDEVDAKAAAVISFGAPLFFSFHHEPTTAPPGGESCGESDDYIAAWQHIRDRFDAAGVTNATYALTLTAQTFERNRADFYYPGADVVDVIAADGYNWYGCEFHPGPWREFEAIFDPFYRYGLSKGLPMIVAEYGSGEDDVPEDGDQGTKAQWFTNASDTLRRWPEIKGVSYFNVGGSCARYVDSTPESLDAYTAMGASPYMNPPTPAVNVTVADFSFTPRRPVVGQGKGVIWSFDGPSSHTVTDSTGLGLFDSGSLAAGSSFRYFFNGAGNYAYACSIHPSMTANVRVPVVVTPLSGDESTEFTVKWAGDFAPTGYVFDIQIKRPGDPWADWRIDQTVNTDTFMPDDGPGTYAVRARYRNSATGETNQYSKPVTIIVG